MNIKKLEQSGFIIESEAGFRLVLDVGICTPLGKLAGEKPVDAFLVSHIHGDHFMPSHIVAFLPKKVYLNNECAMSPGGKDLAFPIEITKAGDVKQIGPFEVTFFAVDHGPNISAPVENLGFLIREKKEHGSEDEDKVENKKSETAYFAGDMFYAPNGEGEYTFVVDELEVDYALIPVGTFYTFGPREAYLFADSFKKIGKIIPMHYERIPTTKDEFTKLCEGKFDVIK